MTEKVKSLGIRFRLIFAFVLVVASMALLFVVFIFFNFQIVEEYKQVVDQLVVENDLTRLVSELMDNYYGVVRSNSQNQSEIDKKHALSIYTEKKNEINGIILRLDMGARDKESQVAYRGLKNIVFGIVEECDLGLADLENNDLTKATKHYDDNLNKKYFVVENTAQLMLKELSYVAIIQKDIDKTHQLIIASGAGLFIVLLFFCIFYGISVSNKIAKPITKLGAIAGEVSSGNLNIEVNKGYFAYNKEVSSLADSFNKMLVSLREKISELKNINQSIIANQAQMEEQNLELKKFNELTVDREMKMIELKKRIKELEEKIKT